MNLSIEVDMLRLLILVLLLSASGALGPPRLRSLSYSHIANYSFPLNASLTPGISVPRVAVLGRYGYTTSVDLEFGGDTAWEDSPIPPNCSFILSMYSDSSGTEDRFAAMQQAALQKKRKKALKRALRLFVIRGCVWYKGQYYDGDNIGGLCELDELRKFVGELYANDTSATGELLR